MEYNPPRNTLSLDEITHSFNLQRENYMKLYHAVVGTGAYAGMIDPIQIATQTREDRDLFEKYLKAFIELAEVRQRVSGSETIGETLIVESFRTVQEVLRQERLLKSSG